MSNEENQLMMLKGYISDMTEEQKQAIQESKEAFYTLMNTLYAKDIAEADTLAMLGYTIFALEMAIKLEKV